LANASAHATLRAMTEEPYRWLEAIGNRREYVREQLRDGSPVFALSLPEGLLLLGVGSGQSKVFEVHDRHAMAALGHPSDIERIRQAAIDAAHVEAFTRAAEDLSLRRLVGFGLSPQLKQSFEQLFSAPVLGEFLFAELGASAAQDFLVRLRYDGTFQVQHGGLLVLATRTEAETAAHRWLTERLGGVTAPEPAADLLLQAWWMLTEKRGFEGDGPAEPERQAGWRAATRDRSIELGFLARTGAGRARYRAMAGPA
jgi:proteasome alpha subunit